MDWHAVLARPTAAPSDRLASTDLASTDAASDDRLDALRADLHARLRTVCAGMPATELAALVETMARRALRWSVFPGADFDLPAQSSR